MKPTSSCPNFGGLELRPPIDVSAIPPTGRPEGHKTERFDKYYVDYDSPSSAPQDNLARIICYNGHVPIGELIFYKNDLINVPQNYLYESESYRMIILYYPISAFNDIINILRYNEVSNIQINGRIGRVLTEMEKAQRVGSGSHA